MTGADPFPVARFAAGVFRDRRVVRVEKAGDDAAGKRLEISTSDRY